MKDIERYTRVTEVLYPFSGLKNVPKEILDNACARGEQVHSICDALISCMGIYEIPTHLEGYIESFKKWAMGMEFIQKPDRFFCEELMLTGEIDGLREENGSLVLFDLKTSAKESKTWSLQGSAYTYLSKKMGINIEKIEFIKLDKMGKSPQIFTYPYHFEDFRKCLDVYRMFFDKPNEENPLDHL